MRFLLSLLAICWLNIHYGQETLLIQNVNVWDGTSDQLKLGQQVLIEGNLVKEVAKEILVDPNVKRIDGQGKTLIPGLSDAHLHLAFTMGLMDTRNKADWMYTAIRAAKAAENFLHLGFTTVRDLGGPVFGLKQAIDEGLIPGPRIFPSGAFISQTSGHGDLRNPNDAHPYWSDAPLHSMDAQGWSFVVDGVPEVLKAARENLKRGATQLKVMAGGGIGSDFDPIHSIQFTPEELAAAVQAAADWDTYVAVHVYHAEGIMRALEAGVKCIDHGHLINEEAIQLLKQKDAWLVPQSHWLLRSEESIEALPPHRAKKVELVLAGAEREMELAKKYDVNLAFGTDAFGPLGGESKALNEFITRSRWYSPVEVLKQATSENAKLFQLSGKLHPYTAGKLGVIAAGAYADLLIYDGNPLEDIQVIVNYQENLRFIMKDGEIIKNELE